MGWGGRPGGAHVRTRADCRGATERPPKFVKFWKTHHLAAANPYPRRVHPGSSGEPPPPSAAEVRRPARAPAAPRERREQIVHARRRVGGAGGPSGGAGRSPGSASADAPTARRPQRVGRRREDGALARRAGAARDERAQIRAQRPRVAAVAAQQPEHPARRRRRPPEGGRRPRRRRARGSAALSRAFASAPSGIWPSSAGSAARRTPGSTPPRRRGRRLQPRQRRRLEHAAERRRRALQRAQQQQLGTSCPARAPRLGARARAPSGRVAKEGARRAAAPAQSQLLRLALHPRRRLQRRVEVRTAGFAGAGGQAAVQRCAPRQRRVGLPAVPRRRRQRGAAAVLREGAAEREVRAIEDLPKLNSACSHHRRNNSLPCFWRSLPCF